MMCKKSRCFLGELMYVNSSVSWLEALDWCEQRGLRLLHILSEATQTQLNLLLSSLEPPYGPADIVWVGLVHCFLQPRETWEWLEGPLERYTHWHPTDFPRWRFGYHCGQVTKAESGDYMWLDDCCSRKRPFVCQKVTDGRSKGTNPARGGRAPCYQRYT
ncbi:rheacalcin-1-like [Engraulis encrasicolus]|uniref:rheacalcin-1-like n=1 Tax=Engraulis encrasicolus TaxID=184585 RepID=UPI002FD34238